MTRALAALALAVVFLGTPAWCDPQPQYTAKDAVSAILAGPRPCPKGRSERSCEADPLTRRWCLGDCGRPSAPAQPARSAPVAAGRRAPHTAVPPPKLSSADILVTFQSGSAQITPQGRANLQSVARALNSDSLGTLNFEIAGYTDASGDEDDNFQLSGYRADAVRSYLISLGVRADRLTAAPYGSSHLAYPADPTSQLNRRVELHRLN